MSLHPYICIYNRDQNRSNYLKGVKTMKQKITVIVSLVAVITMIWWFPFSEGGVVNAYSYNGYKQCTYYVDWRWGGNITSVHKDGFQQALTDWNGAQSKRRFKNGGSSAPGALDSYKSESDYLNGKAIYYHDSRKCITSWVAKLNSINTKTYTHSRSTGNHELGHILGLAHTNNRAIMNTKRNRNEIYRPQTDDINGINNLY
ncbi:hypothetical protein CEN49_27555 [Fischerella thermalis CCMEE 5273]|nr:hypothetical protein CEN49_27555 [Fischerella thermalis CCMEE 5273]